MLRFDLRKFGLVVVLCTLAAVLVIIGVSRKATHPFPPPEAKGYSQVSDAFQKVVNLVFHSGYGCCYRCKKTWDVVEGHGTLYDVGQGCFPLCEKCWSELKTPQARLPYYRQMFNEWNKSAGHSEHEWQLIEKAVMAGK